MTVATNELRTYAWQQLRGDWAPLVATGTIHCWRCHQPIQAGTRWALGHLTDRAQGGTAADGVHPEHQRCSNASGGRLGAARRAARKAAGIRTW